MNFNYCWDQCEHNKGARHHWDETVDGRNITRSKSDASNKKLQCELGYSQTIASRKALNNSLSQGTRICARLKKLFAKEVK